MPATQQGFYQEVCVCDTGIKWWLWEQLFTGWSNPPEILSVRFHGTDITLTWAPPGYTGGERAEYYRVGLRDFYQEYVITVICNYVATLYVYLCFFQEMIKYILIIKQTLTPIHLEILKNIKWMESFMFSSL